MSDIPETTADDLLGRCLVHQAVLGAIQKEPVKVVVISNSERELTYFFKRFLNPVWRKVFDEGCHFYSKMTHAVNGPNKCLLTVDDSYIKGACCANDDLSRIRGLRANHIVFINPDDIDRGTYESVLHGFAALVPTKAIPDRLTYDFRVTHLVNFHYFSTR